MKKLLLLTLLCIGCDSTTEPQSTTVKPGSAIGTWLSKQPTASWSAYRLVIDSGAGGYDIKMQWRTDPELAFKSSIYVGKLGAPIPPDLSFYFNIDNVEQSLDLTLNASIYKGELNGGPLIGFFREGTADSTLIQF